MNEAIFNVEDILEISPELVEELKIKAEKSPRKRFRLCMHHSLADQTQEMLIVFRQGTFMPPHRHPQGKSESYHLVEGSMTVYFFDDNGTVIRSIPMEAYGNDKPFLYRLSASYWHMPLITSDWLVYHETYTGPFAKDSDVQFPEWAPDEMDSEAIQKFVSRLLSANDRLS